MKNMFDMRPFDCSSDAKIVVDTLEACHPVFLLHKEVPGYRKAKTQYIELTKKPVSFTEFRLATLKCFRVLNDSHTKIGETTKNGMYIDVQWVARCGRLYLPDIEKGAAYAEVVTVGGVPAGRLTALVDTYYAAENEAARQYNYAVFCRHIEMLFLAGCRTVSSGIEIVASDGKTTFCGFAPLFVENHDTIRHKMIGDVFYIDMKAFRMDKPLGDTGEKVKTAAKDGIKKFIVDVRDNPGGNVRAGSYLLHLLGMRVPKFGVLTRHSALSGAQKKNKCGEEFTVVEPDAGAAAANASIHLLVLTNVRSFSAAKMFGVWVQDGKLGKIVGRVSRNKPNSYGDPVMVKLPFSQFGFTVSHKKFRRPDTKANPDCLIPDIGVPCGEDILAAALRYMASVS